MCGLFGSYRERLKAHHCCHNALDLSWFILPFSRVTGTQLIIELPNATLRRAFRLGLRTSPPRVRAAPYIAMLEENNARTGFVEDADFDRLKANAGELWLELSGAGRGNRTPTELSAPADFKSAASANFAIPALPINY
jgi:hypothetical protein